MAHHVDHADYADDFEDDQDVDDQAPEICVRTYHHLQVPEGYVERLLAEAADVLPVGRGGKGDQTHSGQDQDASQQSSEENLLEMVRHLHTDLAKEKERNAALEARAALLESFRAELDTQLRLTTRDKQHLQKEVKQLQAQLAALAVGGGAGSSSGDRLGVGASAIQGHSTGGSSGGCRTTGGVGDLAGEEQPQSPEMGMLRQEAEDEQGQEVEGEQQLGMGEPQQQQQHVDEGGAEDEGGEGAAGSEATSEAGHRGEGEERLEEPEQEHEGQREHQEGLPPQQQGPRKDVGPQEHQGGPQRDGGPAVQQGPGEQEGPRVQQELPAEELPAEELPAEELPAEELPAEELQPPEQQNQGAVIAPLKLARTKKPLPADLILVLGPALVARKPGLSCVPSIVKNTLPFIGMGMMVLAGSPDFEAVVETAVEGEFTIRGPTTTSKGRSYGQEMKFTAFNCGDPYSVRMLVEAVVQFEKDFTTDTKHMSGSLTQRLYYWHGKASADAKAAVAKAFALAAADAGQQVVVRFTAADGKTDRTPELQR